MNANRLKNRLLLKKLWLAFGLLFLLIVAVSSLLPLPFDGPQYSDKLAHVFIYAFLSAWFSLLVTKRVNLWWSFALLVCFGILLEVLQGMTAYRSFEVADAIANGIGAALGATAYFSRLRLRLIGIDQGLAESR